MPEKEAAENMRKLCLPQMLQSFEGAGHTKRQALSSRSKKQLYTFSQERREVVVFAFEEKQLWSSFNSGQPIKTYAFGNRLLSLSHSKPRELRESILRVQQVNTKTSRERRYHGQVGI